MTRDIQKEHFNTIAKRYVQGRSHPNHLLFKEWMWRCMFERNAALLPDSITAIDLMAGHGEGYAILSHFLQGKTLHYTGFDLSEEMLAHAREKYPSADFRVQDAVSYRAPEPVDLIVLISGLHHVHHFAEEFMANVNHNLKPGGYLICLEPTENNLFFRLVRQCIYKFHSFFDDANERSFTLKQYHALMARHGFSRVDEIYPGLLAYVLYYNPDIFPYLNRGSTRMVEWMLRHESKYWRSAVARYFSFATLSILRKQ